MNSNFFPKKGVLIAVGELFLKSEGVRKIFKRKLSQNIAFFLKKAGLDFKLFSFRGRIFLKTPNPDKAIFAAKKVFGIVWLADALFFPQAKLEEILEFVGNNYQQWIKKGESFALRLKRGDATESREEIIDKIAEKIKRPVDLSRPKREIFIEIRKPGWFLYFGKINGQGGLPGSTAGKVLSLVSGGIDSPAAAFLIARRGAENIWLHFHSFPLVSKASIEKVKELAKIFLNYQSRLMVINGQGF